LSVTGRIAAIGLLGLCVASGVADVVTALSAFGYALLWKGETVRCGLLAAAGLALLALALCSLWVLEAQARLRKALLTELRDTRAQLQRAAGASPGDEEQAASAAGADGAAGAAVPTAAAAAAADGGAATAGALREALLGGRQQGRAPAAAAAAAGDGDAGERECPLTAAAKGQSQGLAYLTGTAAACVAGVCSGGPRPRRSLAAGRGPVAWAPPRWSLPHT
jgi:hypothetical protein